MYQAYVAQANSGGLSFQNALRNIQNSGTNISMDQLMRTVSQLCDDGRLYSTIDENHYLPTDA